MSLRTSWLVVMLMEMIMESIIIGLLIKIFGDKLFGHTPFFDAGRFGQGMPFDDSLDPYVRGERYNEFLEGKKLYDRDRQNEVCNWHRNKR